MLDLLRTMYVRDYNYSTVICSDAPTPPHRTAVFECGTGETGDYCTLSTAPPTAVSHWSWYSWLAPTETVRYWQPLLKGRNTV